MALEYPRNYNNNEPHDAKYDERRSPLLYCLGVVHRQLPKQRHAHDLQSHALQYPLKHLFRKNLYIFYPTPFQSIEPKD